VCNISVEVNHLAEGIRLGMKQDREQRSAALGRDVVFRGDALISGLPPYLTVQVGGWVGGWVGGVAGSTATQEGPWTVCSCRCIARGRPLAGQPTAGRPRSRFLRRR
jgi:hypothetical protein